MIIKKASIVKLHATSQMTQSNNIIADILMLWNIRLTKIYKNFSFEKSPYEFQNNKVKWLEEAINQSRKDNKGCYEVIPAAQNHIPYTSGNGGIIFKKFEKYF